MASLEETAKVEYKLKFENSVRLAYKQHHFNTLSVVARLLIKRNVVLYFYQLGLHFILYF